MRKGGEQQPMPGIEKPTPWIPQATESKDTSKNSFSDLCQGATTWGPNGLAGQFTGQGGFPGGFTGQQVEDTTTLFENLRWYFVSNFRQVLSELFVEIGLVQTICMVPVQDALRGGILFKSQQLSEDEIKGLQHEMDREGDLSTAGWAAIWNRLYGGAGIMILVDDQDPEEEFDLDSVDENTNVEFRACDMWELFSDKQNTGDYDPQTQLHAIDHYDYYGEKVSTSRVMKLNGIEAPSFVRARLRGWGVSVVEALVRSMNQYLKATDLSFEVLDEFKVDVYKIKNLVNTALNPAATQKVQKTISMLNWQKNYNNAVVLDSEDDWDHKQLSFTGLAEAMAGIRQQVAADMRIPQIKLFGQSFSGGMGNSAQDEMENYNNMVEAEVRGKLKYHILRMAEIRCQQRFGYVPDDLELEFKPLRELTATDQETVKTSKFTRALQAKQAGEITQKDFLDICNKGNLFDVQIDTAGASVEFEDPMDNEDGEGEPGGADKKKNAKDFKESEHPRADDGEFTKGGKGAKSGKGNKEKKAAKAKPELSNPEIDSYKSRMDGLREKMRADPKDKSLRHEYHKLHEEKNAAVNKLAISTINKKQLESLAGKYDTSNVVFHGSLNNDLKGFSNPFEGQVDEGNHGQRKGYGVSFSPEASYADSYTRKETVGEKEGSLYKAVFEKGTILDVHEDPKAVEKLAEKLGVTAFMGRQRSIQPNLQIEQALKNAFPDETPKQLYQRVVDAGIKGFSVEGDYGKEFLIHDPSAIALFGDDGNLITKESK